MKNRPKTRHPKHSRRSCRPILPRRSKGQSPKNKPYAEKPAYGTDTHGTAARKTARKERRGRSPEEIAKERTKDHRGDCERKRNGTITGGRAGREARATAGPGIPQYTTKGRRRELSLRRPFIAIPGIPYSLYWNLALISSTDINAPKSTPSQIQIIFVVRLSAPAPLTTLFSIVMLANEKPRTVIALSEQ